MNLVRLHDGTEVDSASEAWRAECEARHVLAMKARGDRLDYLSKVERRRGPEAAASLRALVMAVWQSGKDERDAISAAY